MYKKQLQLSVYLLFLSAVFFACEKDDEVSKDEETTEVATASRSELTLDSVFYYAKEIYLWYDQLPDYGVFDPRSFTEHSSFLDNLNDEVYQLSQYAINPETGESYEYLADYEGYPKYSFVEESETNSSRMAYKAVSYLNGTDDEFGFALTSIASDDIRIRYVTTGSPAYEAGIRRGDELIEVNGQEVTLDNTSDYNLIVNTFNDSTYPLKVLKPDGSTIETTLVKATYTVNPVFKDSVISTTAGNVGYLAYEMFTVLSNSEPPLREAFESFASHGITSLVLDLRYNGGGYLTTTDYLINSIIPSSFNNQTMYTEQFNELMQNGEATILENQLLLDDDGNPIAYNGRYAHYNDIDYSEHANTYGFEKQGSLNTIENLYIITTEATASASELVYNALKPYLNVTLIGSKTYGKPVGFFPVTIDEYDVYLANFTTINANGEGDYYDGLKPDYEVEDDVSKDFGDPEELCFAKALSLITGTNGRMASYSLRTDQNRIAIHGGKFHGMIDLRAKPIKK